MVPYSRRRETFKSFWTVWICLDSHEATQRSGQVPVYQPMAPMEVSFMGCFTEAGHSLLNVKHACEKEGNAGNQGK